MSMYSSISLLPSEYSLSSVFMIEEAARIRTFGSTFFALVAISFCKSR